MRHHAPSQKDALRLGLAGSSHAYSRARSRVGDRGKDGREGRLYDARSATARVPCLRVRQSSGLTTRGRKIDLSCDVTMRERDLERTATLCRFMYVLKFFFNLVQHT